MISLPNFPSSHNSGVKAVFRNWRLRWHTRHMVAKNLLIVSITFFLAINVAFGAAEDFTQETPVPKLATPVDFSKLVYAEVSKTAAVNFWSMPTERRTVTVNAHESRPASFKIQCDWEQQTATVIQTYVDPGSEPQEWVASFKILTPKLPSICLVRTETWFVYVITMSAEIGAFMYTVTGAPGSLKDQGTTIWYGTCRN
jgi:hypothetical protein